ncbi:hypothetical protein ABZY45_06070 [Streptomyces sp. NPDC006516]|uniref:hypothetical protein n=1 Tax=Streptomyces sp. NPDC006516 TaxID=3154309 RepID=UPI0033B20F54
MVTLSAPNVQDCVALAEIELCGELMIAAADAIEDRLSSDRIDEVLNVRADALDATDDLLDVGTDAAEPAPTIPRQARHRG